MKAILVSIRPQWCELIAAGKKSVEVRKTAIPKGSKVYIYQTKSKWLFTLLPWLADRRGKVIGEFVCDYIEECSMEMTPGDWAFLIERSKINYDQIKAYSNGKPFYAWKISDLKIYSRPKELEEFTGLKQTRFGGMPYKVKRPPQSWCYVDILN